MKSWLTRKIQTLFGVQESLRLQSLLAERLQILQQTFLESQAAGRRDAADASVQAAIRLLQGIEGRLEMLADAAPQIPAPPPSPTLDAAPQIPAPPPSPSPTLDAAPLKRMESQGLFILGSARSGTTVLTKCLNRCPEVFMLEEPNFFQNEHIQDFASFFNGMHLAMGNTREKGTYVSPPVTAESGPLELIERLCRQYRYAGEKVAIGPHDYPSNWKQLYLDFHAKYFLRSVHFLTIRAPNEVLWSMHKLFPSSPIPRLFKAWLESLALTIDVYRVCPNSYFLFFSDFDSQMLGRLGRLLDLEIEVPESMLGGNYVRSRLEEGELPPLLAPYSTLCRECDELYRKLRENTHRESFVYCGPAPEWHFFHALRQQIGAMVEHSLAADELHRAAA